MTVPARDRPDRRTLDRVFGDVLPETTGDERDERDTDRDGPARERWYEENRPPHHG